ncbi:MAG: tyrosine-type recombinase/integrase [Proteobacteria bacterium]|nr:tyrosine-type recombinase/integrase [Pseudomonadota bacterium]
MFDPARSRHTQIASEWLAKSALACYADTYVQYLTERGYAAGTIKCYFGSIAHFAHWLAGQEAGLADIGEDLIGRFLDRHLLHCRCAPRCRRMRTDGRAALGHLLKMLRANGQCAPRHSTVPDAIAAELEHFDCFLSDVRGLSTATRSTRLRCLRDFLIDRFGTGPVQLSSLGPADVICFIEHYTSGWAPGSIKQAGTSLRSYFAFRATQGEQTKALAAALPRVAQWRLAPLPQVLCAQEITQLLKAFDRSAATGQRDYAIVRCLLDLGLRRTEVARLRLEDVDWRAGTLRIHTKGKRIDVLPLPQKTGTAITAYLQNGRPQTTRRELFVRHRPPINAPASADIVRNAARNAAKRCGLEHRIRGTHVFRHTLAARLVQSGAGFKQIADMLRHRCLDTTTIYAKVDLQALSRVALPWPGRQP